MARHVHDDFSFLPTVDSADEKHVVKEELWGAKPPQPAAAEPEAHEEEPVETPEPVHEEAYTPPPVVSAPPVPVKAPTAVNKVRVFEPDADHPPALAEAAQDGGAMWRAFASEQGFDDAPTILTPKARAAAAAEETIEPVVPRRAEPRATPKVSFAKEEKKFTPAAPAPLTMKQSRTEGPPPLPQGPAPAPKQEAPAVHTGVAADPEAAPADNTNEIKNAKKRAILMTVGVHVVVAFILLLMHVPMMDFTPPEIVATSAVEELENESWKKVTSAAPQTSPMAASVSPLLSTGVSDIAMPAVDFSATASDLNLGTSFGSFGSGVTTGGAGGKISFLGNTATAKHVVFVVDVSGSMSASMNVEGSGMMTRFDLLKKELAKSISAMAAGTAYQILFFSDFAWPHDMVDSNDMRALSNYEWKITATSRNVSIPRFSYLATNPANIGKSKKIIAESNNPGGTNWGSGLLMALKGSPKPDVIFFMTDGNRSDEQGWINAVTTENSRGKRTIIHTTALGTPDAARDLDEMARRNGGKFTVVMADGKIVQGKDLLR
ncbi:hypothetical protein [Prosthecobacter sp.]|uniref:hypothetical protein n=1 Tax=Prosthecobacter sp. TaxID=1965333 RepID=UPI002AB9227C|nr:hypothetical protein [Prosthecobacter sp.]MDZ4401592.1 hypothetical protein [Prosthecobacter sp.]